jgi:hypothetical protein
LDFFGQKSDFSGKKRTDLGAFFEKGPLSDQGLIKRTYLPALEGSGICRSSIGATVHARLVGSLLSLLSVAGNLSASARLTKTTNLFMGSMSEWDGLLMTVCRATHSLNLPYFKGIGSHAVAIPVLKVW